MVAAAIVMVMVASRSARFNWYMWGFCRVRLLQRMLSEIRIPFDVAQNRCNFRNLIVYGCMFREVTDSCAASV